MISLCEHRCDGGVLGSAADVVLARGRSGGVDDELARLDVVGRRGFEFLDVAAVTGLGHRKATEQVQIDQRLDVRLVVTLGAEVFDGAAEQTPLDAGLDHQ